MDANDLLDIPPSSVRMAESLVQVENLEQFGPSEVKIRLTSNLLVEFYQIHPAFLLKNLVGCIA